MKEKINCIHT